MLIPHLFLYSHARIEYKKAPQDGSVLRGTCVKRDMSNLSQTE